MISNKLKIRHLLNITVISLFCMTCFTKAASSESDTTYGETRLTPKTAEEKTKSTSADNKRHRHSHENRNKDSIASDFWGFIIGETFNFIIIEPFKAFFTRGEPVDNFSETPFKWGLGLSFFDFSFYPQTSLSWALKINGDFIYAPNEVFAFREHIGAHLSTIGGTFSDFERDVFVDGNIIGQEKDKVSRYHNFSIPFYSEVLYRPCGPEGSFFFSIGGGPRYVYEKAYISRGYSYNSITSNITVNNSKWIPSFTFGIGRLVYFGESFGSFEIKYSLGINDNHRNISVPSDNSRFVHGITIIQYGLIF